MCCAFFWLNAHPQLLLLLAFNRDELLARPTDQLHAWNDSDIIGGRDRVNGGTWLGLTRGGRFAFVTNFREVGMMPQHAMSYELVHRSMFSEDMKHIPDSQCACGSMDAGPL